MMLESVIASDPRQRGSEIHFLTPPARAVPQPAWGKDARGMPAWTRLGPPLPGQQDLGNLTIPVTGLLTPGLLTKGLGGFNPVLTNVLVKLNTTGTAGVPRGSLTVPVSPVPNPNDTTLFE